MPTQRNPSSTCSSVGTATVLYRISRDPCQLIWINRMKGNRQSGLAEAQGYNTGKFPIPCGYLG